MFDPSRDQVRETFFGAWRKYRAGEPLVGIETIALDVILGHPEYHAMLGDPERYREKDYLEESNPFLHMSLHVALAEQLSISRRASSSASGRWCGATASATRRCTRRSSASPRWSGGRSATNCRPTREATWSASGAGCAADTKWTRRAQGKLHIAGGMMASPNQEMAP